MNIDYGIIAYVVALLIAIIAALFASGRLESARNARNIGQREDLSAEEKTEALGDCISDLAEGILLLFLTAITLVFGAFFAYAGVVTDLIRAATGH